MAINFHPDPGTIVVCDFTGFVAPEMIKRRPAIVVSPRFRQRDNLCSIVPLSTSRPKSICAYHCQIDLDPVLPAPYDAARMWVKADMLNAVSFSRLSLPYVGKDEQGKRAYDVRHISDEDLEMVVKCLLNGLGLGRLTEYV